jgi:transposase
MTYAPRGRRPVLHARLDRVHLSAISGITPGGKLYMQVIGHSFKGPDVVRFLRHLLRHLGRVLVVWDGLPAHRGEVVKTFLRQEAAGLIHLERLPSYAPELNPDEGIWKHLKREELANLCCEHLGQLRQEVRRAKERLRHRPDVIIGCIRHAGLV